MPFDRQSAGRLEVNGQQGVGSVGRATRFFTDVERRAKEVAIHGRIRVDFLGFQRPGRFGAVDLFEVCAWPKSTNDSTAKSRSVEPVDIRARMRRMWS